MNNEFNEVGLYDHNAESYKKIKNAFETEENVVGIVHATGTGKSYNALQLAYDNKDKKIIYVVPSHGIIEHIKEIINENSNLDFERDFPNLEFRTYQSLINLSREEITELDVDLLMLDEFHHIGAPVWGARINTIIETHQNIKLFGMTAYTVRDRGTPYERDMANPNGEELFSNKIVSRYDLCDAMIDGVLPKPIYKSAYTNLIGLESELEEKVLSIHHKNDEKEMYLKILRDVKKRIAEAPSIADVVKKNVKANGKYIYFCPPGSEEGINDIETIKKEAIEWFRQYIPEENIIFYTTTSQMGEEGKQNREAFYRDVTLDGKSANKKLRIMFAINQYNEGIHAPNIDGVIMGRSTQSDIVYFEQLGRALSVRGDTRAKFEEFENYTNSELINMCKERDIEVAENISKTELIENLIAPTVIDLTNNFDFMKELENNLKDRVKEAQISKETDKKRIINLSDASFDIEMVNQDLFEMLRYVRDRISKGWDYFYELSCAYYEYYNNLEVLQSFKTSNGYEYDENGVCLGSWLNTQRGNYKKKLLTNEQIDKLNKIGMRFTTDKKERDWQEKYELAKIYYEHYNNLKIPQSFKTKNGYEYNEDGIPLGKWVNTQRMQYRNGILKLERQKKLEQIGIIFEKSKDWNKYYQLAKTYYLNYGNLNITQHFKTENGIDYDENGIALGEWISGQRYNHKLGKLTEERKQLLDEIGMNFKIVDYWQQSYDLAKIYYEHYGDLEINYSFNTKNGYEYDEKGIGLGRWIYNQRKKYKDRSLSPKQIEKLKKIGMNFEINTQKRVRNSWDSYYNLAKAYYEHNGNLNIPQKFKTLNGYEYDENGVNLGYWIDSQKNKYKNNRLMLERQVKLERLGMNFENSKHDNQWDKYYNLAKIYYQHNGNLNIPQSFRTINGYDYDVDGIHLGNWVGTQRTNYMNGRLTTTRQTKLKEIGFNFEQNLKEIEWNRKYELIKNYYEHYHTTDIPMNFMTKNGIDYDENGIDLRSWSDIQKKSFAKGKMTEERQKKLESINFDFSQNKFERDWQNNYDLAKIYYNHFHNLNIPVKFMTSNGYEHDNKGITLGRWISKQRSDWKSGKLSNEKKEKLNSIGMIWFATEKNFTNQEINASNKENMKEEILKSFQTLLEEIKNNEINSKKDVDDINTLVKDSLGKK